MVNLYLQPGPANCTCCPEVPYCKTLRAQTIAASRQESKACFCHTCNTYYHALGIMRHRAMPRDRRENCDITYSGGDRYKYNYAGQS